MGSHQRGLIQYTHLPDTADKKPEHQTPDILVYQTPDILVYQTPDTRHKSVSDTKLSATPDTSSMSGYKPRRPAPPPPNMPGSDTLRKYFDRVDSNKSGTITPKELQAAL